MQEKKICKRNSKARAFLLTAICLATSWGCQGKEDELIQKTTNQQSQEVSRLEKKIEKLDQIVKENILTPASNSQKAPSGKIKSITFRIGTEDGGWPRKNRLRIYWEDGSTSDLPCTKEQFTWACG